MDGVTDQMFVSPPQNSYVEALICGVPRFGGRTSKKVIKVKRGHKDDLI